MSKTAPFEGIGAGSVGYVYVALPSDNMRRQVTELQAALTRELPDVLWPTPAEALHMTLCEIIQPKEYSEDKESLFARHGDEYIGALTRILSGFRPIMISFDTIEASANAVIVRGKDDGSFNRIREQLVRQISLPAETKTPPDIIHSSIGRYLGAVELEEVQKVISRHTVRFQEEIKEFRLLRVTKQPLLQYETVQVYQI